MRTLIPLLACGLALAAPAAAAQQTPPPGGTPKDFRVPEARTFQLPNGMDVTMVPYGTLPKVAAQLVVRTGNVDEGPEQVWLADVTADLMQEGTTTRSGEEIDRAAAAMGGSLNAGVGMDQTVIGGDVLSEFGPELVALIADVVRNPSFPASELDRLKTDRVRQLSIALSQPGPVAQQKFRSVLYPDHPYGRLYPTAEMLQGYTAEQVRRFYGSNYGAARSHLYVAGRFDPAAVEAAVREAFAGWEAGPPPAQNVPQPVARRGLYVVNRPGAVQSTLMLGLPVVDPSHPDYVPLQVTNALLGGSFGSRITRNIREDKGYTYSPISSVSSRRRDAYWVQNADVTTDVTGASLREIFHEVDSLRATPPPAEELQGIQNYVAGTFVLQNSDRNGIISQLQFLNLHGLDEDYLEEYVRRVYAVTPQEVQRIARQYLRPDATTIVVVGDESKIAQQLQPYGPVAR
jgi:zinc protease